MDCIANFTSIRRLAWFALRLQAGAMLLLSAACSVVPQLPPGVTQVAASPVISTEAQSLSPLQMSEVTGTAEDSAYRLGADDIIAVNVYSHPELTIPPPGVSSSIPGALITGDGSVQLPLIGNVELGGYTLEQAAQVITTGYQQYIPNPEVSVQLVQAHSFRYYLLGEFSDPGIKYPGHALPLLAALALGGSVNLQSADLYQAYVSQNGVKLPVDLHRLLVNGDMTQNIMLASGDTIVVPSAATESAFVFGSVNVTSNKAGEIPFVNGSLSLLQAMTGAGMNLTDVASARFTNVRIIRSEGGSGQLIVVDAALILEGKAADFPLQPGDIVYVPGTGVANWNQAIEQLLPSLQAVSDLLNPFVSIKYLDQ